MTPYSPTRAVACALALLAAACADAPKTPERSTVPLLVPAGGEAYLRFESGQAVLVEGGRSSVASLAPAGAGHPAAAFVDLGGEYAAVAYDAAIARVRLSERDVAWLPISARSAPGAIAVSGARAIAIAGNSIRVVDLARDDAAEEIDTSAWLREHQIGVLVWAQPVGPTSIVFAGATERGAAALDTIVERVDTAGGTWTETGNTRIGELHRLHACGSDGVALYVAGVREERVRTTPGSISAADLRQTLIVVRVDLTTLAARTVVREPRSTIDTRVVQIACGGDVVALVLEGGELSVHRVPATGASGTPRFSRGYGQPISAAWLDASRIAVLGASDGRVRVETIP